MLWRFRLRVASMKVPPKRKGNEPLQGVDNLMLAVASMKVPPKRKGNPCTCFV